MFEFKGRKSTTAVEDNLPDKSRQQALLEGIASQAPGMLYQYQLKPDGQHCFPYASDRIRDLFEMEPEAIREDAEPIFALIDKRDVAGLRDSVARSAERMEEWKCHFRVNVGGREKWMLGSSVPTKMEDGSIVWSGLVMDITEQKRMEENLSFITESLTLATESAGVGVWMYDLEMKGLSWDGQMMKLYGLDDGEFGGTVREWMGRIHPEDVIMVDEAFQAAVHMDAPFDVEYRVFWPNGKIRYLRGGGKLVRGEAGGPSHFIGINWDNTKARSNEENLRRANQQLEQAIQRAREAAEEAKQASRAKSQFLAMMSHEIRTPMNGVLGFAEMLSQTKLTKEQEDCLEMIRKSGDSLLTLINNILDYSGIEFGRLALVEIPVHTRDFLEELGIMTQQLALKKGLLVFTECQKDVPDLFQGDLDRMRQILMNLAGNAVKFTNAGSVTISVRFERDWKEQFPAIAFTIKDTGCGIAEDAMASLYQPFTMGDASSSRKFGGTGLGLAIAKKLAELMNGALECRSQKGVGSEFTLYLPYIQPGHHLEQLKEPEVKPAILDNSFARKHPREILVVEDHPTNRQLAKMMLKRLGYEVEFAFDGNQALEQCHQKIFDVIFMDIQMPGIDGVETSKRVRTIPKNRTAYIVAMTAHAMVGDREKMLAEGMNEYVSKPLKLQQIAEVLETSTVNNG